jgi:hypothetical protein
MNFKFYIIQIPIKNIFLNLFYSAFLLFLITKRNNAVIMNTGVLAGLGKIYLPIKAL